MKNAFYFIEKYWFFAILEQFLCFRHFVLDCMENLPQRAQFWGPLDYFECQKNCHFWLFQPETCWYVDFIYQNIFFSQSKFTQPRRVRGGAFFKKSSDFCLKTQKMSFFCYFLPKNDPNQPIFCDIHIFGII